MATSKISKINTIEKTYSLLGETAIWARRTGNVVTINIREPSSATYTPNQWAEKITLDEIYRPNEGIDAIINNNKSNATSVTQSMPLNVRISPSNGKLSIYSFTATAQGYGVISYCVN